MITVTVIVNTTTIVRIITEGIRMSSSLRGAYRQRMIWSYLVAGPNPSICCYAMVDNRFENNDNREPSNADTLFFDSAAKLHFPRGRNKPCW
jgi:hypothetical protein